MKTRHISCLLWIILLLFALPASAQEMAVKSMVHDPFDQTANLSENMHKDNNLEYGGLVKVMVAASGATFEGWVLEQKAYSASEYWVFMAKGSDRLKVTVPGYLPLEVDFNNYDDCIVKSLHTYVLTITLPQTGVRAVQDDGMRYLAMTVDPKNSTVFVDGTQQTVDANGEVSVLLPKGTHGYRVLAPGYATKEGSVEVGDDNSPLSVKLVSTHATLKMTVDPKSSTVFVDGAQQTVGANGELSVLLPKGTHSYRVLAPGYATKEGSVEVDDGNSPLSVKLVSTQATLRVECATRGAQVFVNNQQRGVVPWTGLLTSGSYQVEVRSDGYRPQKQTVSLSENENRTLTIPELEKITGRLNVDCRPLGSEVYVDGVKVGTTPNIFRDIQVGQRRVEIRKEGYETLTKTVTINENEQASVTGTLIYGLETFTVNGVSFTMVRVDGGTFTMGATEEQGSDAYDDEKPTHQVTLSTYMIGETEVTQALWQAVMGNNPSKFTSDSSRPVEMVSWDDCQEFIRKLNSMTGKTFRLPTEAEWEYAARGGNKSRHYKYSGSNNLDDVAWYGDNNGSQIHRVKTKSPNELGLYDMSGNVWEWCSDWYGDYSSSAQTDPKGPASASIRVYRGGSWNCGARLCRVSNRSSNTPGDTYNDLGLRLAL